jgi:hypothetical protein
MFLNNDGWVFDGARADQPYNYFDYPIDYDVVSWEKNSYYHGQHLLLYTSTGKSNIVIYQAHSACFNELLQGLNSRSGTTFVDDNKLVTIIREGDITIEFREYKNDYSSRQYSILLFNSAALSREIQTLKDQEEALLRAEEERKRIYERALSKGDLLFSAGNFDLARIEYYSAFEIYANDLLESKIELCDQRICDRLIFKGDSLFRANLFEKALAVFIEASGCSKLQSSLQEKIKSTESKILEAKISKIQIQGDGYFRAKKYDLALDAYNSILQLDKWNIQATDKIRQIEEIKALLEKRSSIVFSYFKTNKINLVDFQNILLDDLSERIIKSQDGFLNINYRISFDTSGNNLSSIQNISSSLVGYSDDFKSIADRGILTPSSEGGYYLASSEDVRLNAKWSTSHTIMRSKAKGVYVNNDASVNITNVEKFISQQTHVYGKYILEIKNKEVNGKSSADVYLSSYRAVGPEAALLSAIMPGLGCRKVTYGGRGWGRFTLFILSSGLAVSSKLYSDLQYNNYLGASNQKDIDTYYANSNVSHKIALVSLGISASIYIYDIIWVIARGSKNLRESKMLRKQLQQGPVQIQTQSISW